MSFEFHVVKDFGILGKVSEKGWAKHLTKTAYGDGDAKWDIRAWNEDMTKLTKGITLSDNEMEDLYNLLKNHFEGGVSNDEDSLMQEEPPLTHEEMLAEMAEQERNYDY